MSCVPRQEHLSIVSFQRSRWSDVDTRIRFDSSPRNRIARVHASSAFQKERETSVTADRRPPTYHEEQVEGEHQVLDGLRRQAQFHRRHCRRTCRLRFTALFLSLSRFLSLWHAEFLHTESATKGESRAILRATRERRKTRRKKAR